MRFEEIKQWFKYGELTELNVFKSNLTGNNLIHFKRREVGNKDYKLELLHAEGGHPMGIDLDKADFTLLKRASI